MLDYPHQLLWRQYNGEGSPSWPLLCLMSFCWINGKGVILLSYYYPLYPSDPDLAPLHMQSQREQSDPMLTMIKIRHLLHALSSSFLGSNVICIIATIKIFGGGNIFPEQLFCWLGGGRWADCRWQLLLCCPKGQCSACMQAERSPQCAKTLLALSLWSQVSFLTRISQQAGQHVPPAIAWIQKKV